MDEGQNGGHAEAGSVEVELFVRAGKNGESLGGCPVCHRFFMMLLMKAEYHPEMSLIVTTVNPARNMPDVLRAQVFPRSTSICRQYSFEIGLTQLKGTVPGPTVDPATPSFLTPGCSLMDS